MRKLVTALLQSIPDLVTAAGFLLFLLCLYGVVGVEFWSGALHARCRLTPYPLRLEEILTYEAFTEYQEEAIAQYVSLPCADDDGAQIPVANSTWNHDTSPWNKPRICFWPIAEEEIERTCTLNGNKYRECALGQVCAQDMIEFWLTIHDCIVKWIDLRVRLRRLWQLPLHAPRRTDSKVRLGNRIVQCAHELGCRQF